MCEAIVHQQEMKHKLNKTILDRSGAATSYMAAASSSPRVESQWLQQYKFYYSPFEHICKVMYFTINRSFSKL